MASTTQVIALASELLALAKWAYDRFKEVSELVMSGREVTDEQFERYKADYEQSSDRLRQAIAKAREKAAEQK